MSDGQLESIIKFVLCSEDIGVSVGYILNYLAENYEGEYDVAKATKIIKEMM